jgi:hypothetical protein
MKQAILLFIVLCLALCLCTAPLDAAGEKKRFKIEVYGGLALLNPADLNALPQYDQDLETYFSTARYAYYDNLYGDFFTVSGEITGELKKIKLAMPMGFRFKYRLSRRWWVSLGFKRMSKQQNSSVTHQYQVHSVDPDGLIFDETYTITRANDPYAIDAEGYAPLLGFHFTLGGSLAFNVEGFIAGGPLFGSVGHSKERVYRDSEQQGYVYENRNTYAMDGKGTGIAVEAGVRVNVRLTRGVHLFLEGAYAYQRVNKISGGGSSETFFTDIHSSGYTISDSWEGEWQMLYPERDEDWGEWLSQFPSNLYALENADLFELDLSGFQLTAGISFTF